MASEIKKKSVKYEAACVEKGCSKKVSVSGVGIKKIDLWDKAKEQGWTVRSTTKIWCKDHSPSAKRKKAQKAAAKPAKKAKPKTATKKVATKKPATKRPTRKEVMSEINATTSLPSEKSVSSSTEAKPESGVTE